MSLFVVINLGLFLSLELILYVFSALNFERKKFYKVFLLGSLIIFLLITVYTLLTLKLVGMILWKLGEIS